MLRHPLTHVRAGRYRTRTAAEATAACGGNREPRLGPRSDFSKPCQGAAEKSANATRTGASRQIPSRFPTARNVYRDDCRFVVDGTGREPGQAKAGYHHEGDILPFDILNKAWYTRLSSINRNLYIKENIDETVFMFALFKCRKSDKGRN